MLNSSEVNACVARGCIQKFRNDCVSNVHMKTSVSKIPYSNLILCCTWSLDIFLYIWFADVGVADGAIDFVKTWVLLPRTSAANRRVQFMALFFPVSNFLKRKRLAISAWSLSRKARNSLVHSINGNSAVNIRRKSKAGSKVKDFSTSSFWIGDRSKITEGLVKLCKPRKIAWVAKKYCDRFDGKAFGMEDFIVFYWRAKETISFSGKGAVAAKNWFMKELDIAPQLDIPTSINIAKECEMEIDEVSKTKVQNVECKSDLVRPEGRDVQMSWSNFNRTHPIPLGSEVSMIGDARKEFF